MEGEDIGENSMCCERAATVASTKIEREVQGHLSLGGGESWGMWWTNGDPPEKSEGQIWLASLARSREKDIWLC